MFSNSLTSYKYGSICIQLIYLFPVLVVERDLSCHASYWRGETTFLMNAWKVYRIEFVAELEGYFFRMEKATIIIRSKIKRAKKFPSSALPLSLSMFSPCTKLFL